MKLKWIETDLVLTIHKIQISRFGGLYGIRDISLLESALARPKHYYAFCNNQDQISARLACKYIVSIIQNHPFVDGNKRTALISMHLFLRLNNVKWTASEEMQYIKVIALASGKISEDEFAEWVQTTLETDA